VRWIPPEQKAGLEALRGLSPADVHARLAAMFTLLIPSDVGAPAALALLGAGPADEAAMAAPGARERLGQMLTASFAQGAAGLAADVAGYSLRPWGFEPAEVRAKTLLLYGSADPVAASAHGRWWQRHLPDARLEMAPGAGHLLVVPRWRRALSHLAPR
jgi:pimeloyl-ACP methyl ester carboxylesterase